MRVLVLIPLILLISCQKDEPFPSVDPVENYEMNLAVDSLHRIILFNGDGLQVIDNQIFINGNNPGIQTNEVTLTPGKSIAVTHLDKTFRMFYTTLPIITITTADTIVNEPKISGTLEILENGNPPFTSTMGIELRGGVSRKYPKKSYNIELWKDENGTETSKKKLLGMRDDDDWILDGLWNEPNRLRDYISHEIWLKIARTKHLQPSASIGIQREYCEVLVNGHYKGLYYLGEKIDRKQLDLAKYENVLQGELYKGDRWADGVSFRKAEQFDNGTKTWSGFEAKYPDKIGEIDWTNLYELVSLVARSDNETFNSEIVDKIDIQNAVDFFIFLNYTFAEDNTGKNTYIAKVDRDSKYFFVPWDMDGTFGSNWDGIRINRTTSLLSNGLFTRLQNHPRFKEELIERWATLRNGILSEQSVSQMFQSQYQELLATGVYERERMVPELTQKYSEEEMVFIQEWISARSGALDVYFEYP